MMFSIDVLHVAWSAVLFVIFTGLTGKASELVGEFNKSTTMEPKEGRHRLYWLLVSAIGLAVSFTWLLGFAARVIANMLAG